MSRRARGGQHSRADDRASKSRPSVNLEDLREFVAPRLVSLGYELVDVRMVAAEGRRCLEVLIDKPGGVMADDCQAVGQHVSLWIDLLDPLSERFMLQVSSPGLDRPLRTLAHFERFVGSRVAVLVQRDEAAGDEVEDGRAPRRRFRGRIVAVSDGRITLATDEGDVDIEHQQIERARLDPEWDD